MNPVFDKNALSGKRILVTGASSGIGKAAALIFAGCGAELILAGRNEERLTSVHASLPGSGHNTTSCEFSDADQVYEWISGLAAQYGAFSGVFHAAGVELLRPARMIKQQHLDYVYDSSINAAFGIARAASSRKCVNDGASIVFMSSVAALTGQQGLTAYSAVKAGINGMVRSLACELAPRRVRVNAIAAGAVQTEMHNRITRASGADAAAAYEAAHLLGFGTPKDIADAALFLHTDASKWITGTTLVVDGGYSTR